MYGRWILAGVALVGVSACTDAALEDWVQKCVLNGRDRATCECLGKELKPEWRDMALKSEDNRVEAHIGAEAFAARSNALSTCEPAAAN